jgi:hypothetical protein
MMDHFQNSMIKWMSQLVKGHQEDFKEWGQTDLVGETERDDGSCAQGQDESTWTTWSLNSKDDHYGKETKHTHFMITVGSTLACANNMWWLTG